MNNEYRVITHKSNFFTLDNGNEQITVKARGKLKRDGEIMVGDFVEVDTADEKVITKVRPRKNSLIRPSVANIDQIVLIVAPQPEIDWFLIDKMVINCHENEIDCVICLNKTDLGDNDYQSLVAQYEKDVVAVVKVCAEKGEIEQLKPYLKDKLTCFAGQSGVGKSTLSNLIYGSMDRKVGQVSEKIGRGKNTTTTASIITTDDGFTLIDTPGFSMLDVFSVKYDELALYYNEFVFLADECKFHPCTHTTEPDCAVKRALIGGQINAQRYERYLKIFEEQKRIDKENRR
ncbi:MAG: ribosome small subunit-dependent GTPase A [Clostridia bacterium]|nr:ribosome small subunit-dependent GTPase A [Clostridia bacterium]